ncbi:sugar kinase [Amycolatopsis acidiphila]|uniref:Sugar kinase n=1 Tax=Amycolatopsis acidiphila TaxID=715473 RepID=A0A558AKJ2_9PSEU|nr:sugar kinase [Amycolatopsis acidiphila]TVT24777.1 sugar kinase [Amycolatopsis acidiphila]UIJ62748.1 sugar kinase [Amycolatopsis acidiphila]GHG63948.1 carbohydrate kinase [Amycolatopsis acidiphila]
MTPEVLCIGETMVLVTPVEPGPLAEADLFRLDVGGAESTVALYLRDLGHHSAWAGRVGDDPLGRRLVDAIAGHGVDVRWVRVDQDAPTGVYFKDPGAGGTRVHYYRAGSAASRLSPGDLAEMPIGDAKLVHLSGITPALSASCRALVEAALDRDGPVSFDVNHRPALWSAAAAGPVLLELANRADIVFVGQDEAQTLWDAATPEEVRKLISSARLVVKDGADGATEFDGPQRTFAPAPPVDVVEVVGAGDAFAAGYLSGVLRGLDPATCLRDGHRVAARALGGTGDFVPGGAL